jgi:hypothetical protein
MKQLHTKGSLAFTNVMNNLSPFSEVQKLATEIASSGALESFVRANKSLDEASQNVTSFINNFKGTSGIIETCKSTITSSVVTLLCQITLHIYRFCTSDWVGKALVFVELYLSCLQSSQCISALTSLITSPQLQASGTDSFMTNLVGIAGAIVTGVIPEKSHAQKCLDAYGKKMRNIANINSGVKSMQSLFKIGLDFINSCIQYFLFTFFPESVTLSYFQKSCDGIIEWAERVHFHSRTEVQKQFTFDEALRKEVFKTYDQAEEFALAIRELPTRDPTITTIFNQSFQLAHKNVNMASEHLSICLLGLILWVFMFVEILEQRNLPCLTNL